MSGTGFDSIETNHKIFEDLFGGLSFYAYLCRTKTIAYEKKLYGTRDS